MAAIYECITCGVVTADPGQVCSPIEDSDKDSYCGTAPKRDTMCRGMREHLAYVCGTCGRPAEQAELLCHPLVTG